MHCDISACNVGDEGGFAPNILENDEGLDLLKTAIEKAGYTGKIQIGMDVAASEFCKDKLYDLDFKNKDSKKEDWVGGTFVLWCLFVLIYHNDQSEAQYLWVSLLT